MSTPAFYPPKPMMPWNTGPLSREVPKDLFYLISMTLVSIGHRRSVKTPDESVNMIMSVLPHLIRYEVGTTVVADAETAYDFRRLAQRKLSEAPNAANPGGISDQAHFDLKFLIALDEVDSEASTEFLSSFLTEYYLNCLKSVVRVAHALILRLLPH